MRLSWLIGVPASIAAVIGVGASVGFEKPWADSAAIAALNAVVVENRTLIAGNSERLALLTYDRLIRRLQAEGRLSPRDLRAFCLAAARLQIRHPACR